MSGFPCHILNPDATEEQVLGLEGGGEARQERLADEGQAWPACRGTPPLLWTLDDLGWKDVRRNVSPTNPCPRGRRSGELIRQDSNLDGKPLPV
jgi:hypothetical protein